MRKLCLAMTKFVPRRMNFMPPLGQNVSFVICKGYPVVPIDFLEALQAPHMERCNFYARGVVISWALPLVSKGALQFPYGRRCNFQQVFCGFPRGRFNFPAGRSRFEALQLPSEGRCNFPSTSRGFKEGVAISASEALKFPPSFLWLS